MVYGGNQFNKIDQNMWALLLCFLNFTKLQKNYVSRCTSYNNGIKIFLRASSSGQEKVLHFKSFDTNWMLLPILSPTFIHCIFNSMLLGIETKLLVHFFPYFQAKRKKKQKPDKHKQLIAWSRIWFWTRFGYY